MTDFYQIVEAYDTKKETVDVDYLLNELLEEDGVTSIEDITILGKHRLLVKLDIDDDDFRTKKGKTV